MKDNSETLRDFLEEYVNTHSISFLREEPHVLASRISTFFSSLSFPHTEEHFLEGLKQKALQCLWNTILDDTIEYTKRGKEEVFDSLQVVTTYRNGVTRNGKTESGSVIHDFIQRFYSLPSGPNKKSVEELLFLDLINVLNGFEYERIIQENCMVGTLSEYMEFGAITFDMRVYLDIDIALYPYSMSPSAIGYLREAYRWFTLAFKLSSDIATFEREFFVERSHNAVILHGQETGELPENVLRSDWEYKERLIERIIPSLMNDIEEKGREYLRKSLECLEKINDIDITHISAAFASIFENYPGPRMFSLPIKKEMML